MLSIDDSASDWLTTYTNLNYAWLRAWSTHGKRFVRKCEAVACMNVMSSSLITRAQLTDKDERRRAVSTASRNMAPLEVTTTNFGRLLTGRHCLAPLS
jgi:hypothetical protein